MKLDDYLFGNQFEIYGKATFIKRKLLIGLFVVVCCITPGTNWMIPFSKKLIKNDLIIRYR